MGCLVCPNGQWNGQGFTHYDDCAFCSDGILSDEKSTCDKPTSCGLGLEVRDEMVELDYNKQNAGADEVRWCRNTTITDSGGTGTGGTGAGSSGSSSVAKAADSGGSDTMTIVGALRVDVA